MTLKLLRQPRCISARGDGAANCGISADSVQANNLCHVGQSINYICGQRDVLHNKMLSDQSGWPADIPAWL